MFPMKPIDLFKLIILSSLWGASFLFMRMAAPDFGPIALIELRTAIAAIFLLPIILWKKKLKILKDNFGTLLVAGLFSSAIPFCLLSYATLYVSAGYASILNATTPIFTALIAWVWIKEKLSIFALGGLVLGFVGVFVLTFDSQDVSGGVSLIAVIAGLGATVCYGIAINFTKQKCQHLNPLVIAFGSQLGAALILLPLSIYFWPQHMPSTQSWVAVSILGVASTGIAFILFFGLIASLGSNKAASVTYLIPFFAVIWGFIFLKEALTSYMMLGGFFILFGVALSTGLISRHKN